jgi:hypothetical protein
VNDPDLDLILAGGAELLRQRDAARDELRAIRIALDLPGTAPHADVIRAIYKQYEEQRRLLRNRAEVAQAAGFPTDMPHEVVVYKLAVDFDHRGKLRELVGQWREDASSRVPGSEHYNTGREHTLNDLAQQVEDILHDGS